MLSCERNANNVVDLPVEDAKFVLFAKPENGKSLELFIEKSKGVLDLGSTLVPGDTYIAIADENGNILESKNGIMPDSNRVNFSSVIFKRGSTYQIQVIHPDFESVKHNFTIPDTISFESIQYSFQEEASLWEGETDEYLKIDFSFQESPQENQYYWIEAYAVYNVKSIVEEDWLWDPESYDSISDGYYHYKDSVYLDFPQEEGLIGDNPVMAVLGQGRAIINDYLINGQTYSIETQVYIYEQEDYYQVDSIEIIARLYRVEKATSDYYLSLEKYSNTADNIFTEPVQVFSNVNNGYGVILPRGGTKKILKIPF